MTRTEYIRRAEEARELDIKERWTPRLTEFDPFVPGCRTCHLDTVANTKGVCTTCIFENCGNEKGVYAQWDYACSQKARFAAAQAMIDFLRAWDIPAWADKLVEKGMLERD